MKHADVKSFLKSYKIDGPPQTNLLDEFGEVFTEITIDGICAAFESYSISKIQFEGNVRDKLKELIDSNLRNLLLENELDELADAIISSGLLRQD